MGKKLNNGNDSTKRKSIDDHERRRQAEKSRAVEQERRTKAMDGSRLVRDVIVKLGLQRQPAEREHINTKIFEASMSLEKLTSADHAREDQRHFESPIPEHHFVHEKAEGLKAQEMTVAELKNPDVLEGYIKGLEEHPIKQYIGNNIENVQVPQTDFERVSQLVAPAYEDRLHKSGKQNLEVESNSPELDR
ncbi:hypothetical protein ACXHWJ_03940 [Alcaligenes nematophilus]|uniref:hypothetical protein n=1 Tax=Alcaligenes faecalis TaxID=511 RepID=UPI0019333060|nr:hypothetical protein [Alcaligenes faecalis]QRF90771.1 hypothetical protein CLH39_11235 [Alcaligenes faecalis]